MQSTNMQAVKIFFWKFVLYMIEYTLLNYIDISDHGYLLFA